MNYDTKKILDVFDRLSTGRSNNPYITYNNCLDIIDELRYGTVKYEFDNDLIVSLLVRATKLATIERVETLEKKMRDLDELYSDSLLKMSVLMTKEKELREKNSQLSNKNHDLQKCHLKLKQNNKKQRKHIVELNRLLRANGVVPPKMEDE